MQISINAATNARKPKNAAITNNRGLSFDNTSTAGNATIVTNNNGITAFAGNMKFVYAHAIWFGAARR